MTRKRIIDSKTSPPHPGRVLKDIFLDEIDISLSEFAKIIKTTRQTISQLVNCKRSMTVDIAFKLADYFQNDPDMWVTLQKDYDLWEYANSKKAA